MGRVGLCWAGPVVSWACLKQLPLCRRAQPAGSGDAGLAAEQLRLGRGGSIASQQFRMRVHPSPSPQARLLCIALVQTFHAGRPAEIKHASAALPRPMYPCCVWAQL